jgi:hypothetical protein
VDEDDEVVIAITPITSARTPEEAILLNGRLTDEIWPEVTVKLVDVPIAVPDVLLKLTLPVQEAAVPLVALLARFATFTWMVSVLPTPMGPIVRLCVVAVVVVVCANKPGTAATADTTQVITILRKYISYLS